MGDDEKELNAQDKKLVSSTEEKAIARKGHSKGSILSLIWNGMFKRQSGDIEKKLAFLSKEEASIHSRLQRRAQRWRYTARNLIIYAVISEVVAVIYAIMTTRSPDLRWQLRAARVLPMFVIPGVTTAVHSMLSRYNRMCDQWDHKKLESLEAERQARIDELKEKTNYYITQQLIQKYDTDPAAKAAAAAILASKLGADSGVKITVHNKDKANLHQGSGADSARLQTDCLRNRKSCSRDKIAGEGVVEDGFANLGHSSQLAFQNQIVPCQQKSANEPSWFARIAAMLVGEDPTQCYALICSSCHMHNGLVRKEDFPYVTYHCPHCHAFNGSKHLQEPSPHLDSSAASGSLGSEAADLNKPGVSEALSSGDTIGSMTDEKVAVSNLTVSEAVQAEMLK